MTLHAHNILATVQRRDDLTEDLGRDNLAENLTAQLNTLFERTGATSLQSITQVGGIHSRLNAYPPTDSRLGKLAQRVGAIQPRSVLAQYFVVVLDEPERTDGTPQPTTHSSNGPGI